MLFVKVPKEIKEYQEKVFLGLSLRQFLWGISGIVLGFISFFIFNWLFGSSVASYLVMLITAPCFACGFIQKQEMPFDRYLALLFRYYTKKQIVLYENFDGWIETFSKKEASLNVSKKERKRRKKETKKIQENQ